MLSSSYEFQYRIEKPDGTILWGGHAIVGQRWLVKSAASDSNGAAAGQAVVAVDASMLLGNWNLAAASQPVAVAVVGARTTSGAKGFLGVALEPLVAAGVRACLVGGPGTMTTVQVVTPGTQMTFGCAIGASATAGLCTIPTPAATEVGILGTCVKTGVAINSLFECGVLVTGTLRAPTA